MSKANKKMQRITNHDWEIYELQSEFCKALGHPTRLAIIHQLKNSEYTVRELVETLGLRQANLSQHLAMLRDAGIVVTRRSGANVIYSIADEKIVTACSLVQQAIEERISRQRALFR